MTAVSTLLSHPPDTLLTDHFMVSTFIASYLLSRCICYFLEHILGNDQSIVGGTLNVTVIILMLSIPALFDSIPQPTLRCTHHKNCHRDSVVMSIVQLSNFFSDQWKINHQIWLNDNSLCCVRLDSMLWYNPLLHCLPWPRVKLSSGSRQYFDLWLQFNPAARQWAAAAQTFYSSAADDPSVSQSVFTIGFYNHGPYSWLKAIFPSTYRGLMPV